MRKVFNVINIGIVSFLSVITIIILRANLTSEYGYSIRYDTTTLIAIILLLIGSLIFYCVKKSWKMLFITLVGLTEITVLYGVIIL